MKIMVQVQDPSKTPRSLEVEMSRMGKAMDSLSAQQLMGFK